MTDKTNIIIVYAHPRRDLSRANEQLINAAAELGHVKIVDLYAEYPTYYIDIVQEQERLIAHDVIVLQFPLYWYSTPALLKEWQDQVLEYGFAYGDGGTALAGKKLLCVITAGGSKDTYSSNGTNNYPLSTLLTPIQQTAILCDMEFLSPLVLYSAKCAATDDRIDTHIQHYLTTLTNLKGAQ